MCIRKIGVPMDLASCDSLDVRRNLYLVQRTSTSETVLVFSNSRRHVNARHQQGVSLEK